MAVAAGTAERLRTAQRQLLGEVSAFLPERVPLDTLPGPLQPYLDACADLSDRFPAAKGGVRAVLRERFRRFDPQVEDAMRKLSPMEEWTLLTALCALGHTYRWDTVPPRPERLKERRVELPEGLDRPWLELTRRHDLPRVGSMWTLHLCNWRLVDRSGGAAYRLDELTPERLRVAHQWLDRPAASQLEKFSLSFVLTEARGAAAISRFIDALEAAEHSDLVEMGYRLESLEYAIYDMSKAFAESIRDAYVAPDTWLELVQPTFAWGVEENGRLLPGPNGLQMPSIHSLDAALSIPSESLLAQQALAARPFMPRPHRQFLALIDETRGLLRSFVQQTGVSGLFRRHDSCVMALNKFRVAHRARGARYLDSGRYGSSGRISTGMGIEWRPPDGAEQTPVRPDAAADPIALFVTRMNDRIAETESALLARDPRGDEPTVENTFRFLEAADRVALLGGAPRQVFAAGDIIIRQGARHQPLYVLEEGFARVEVQTEHGRAVIARLWPGEVFGEIAFLSNAEATAWVVADTDAEVRAIDRDHVHALVAHSPGLGTRFYESLAVQLASRLRASNLALADHRVPVEASGDSVGRVTRS
jgi:CRP-like cAMP-binding protein